MPHIVQASFWCICSDIYHFVHNSSYTKAWCF